MNIKFYVGEFYRVSGGTGEDGAQRDVLLFHKLSAVHKVSTEKAEQFDAALREQNEEFARSDSDEEIGLMLNVKGAPWGYAA